MTLHILDNFDNAYGWYDMDGTGVALMFSYDTHSSDAQNPQNN